MRGGQSLLSKFEMYACDTELEYVTSVNFGKGKFSGIKKSKKGKKTKKEI
jgi:hypothetical protein